VCGSSSLGVVPLKLGNALKLNSNESFDILTGNTFICQKILLRFQRSAVFYSMFYSTLFYSTVFDSTVRHFTVLHFTLIYFILMYFNLPYCVLLFSFVLFST